MKIRDIFETLRYKIRYGSIVEWYNFWYLVLRKKHKFIPQVASVDETIRKIIDDRCSVSRWRMGARKKVKLERKYVNETAIGSEVADAGEEYRKQIIAQIV